MNHKQKLVNLLSNFPNVSTVPERQAFINTVGLTKLAQNIEISGNTHTFFNTLIDVVVKTDGPEGLFNFIDNVIASDLVGQDRINDLKNLKEEIEKFDDKQWWEEFGYYSTGEFQLPAKNHQNLNKIIKRLSSAKKQGKEGDVRRKNGSFFEYDIHLEDVFLEFPSPSITGDRSIQKYEIQGKWSSYVYQEINFLGMRVDKPWGTKKRPKRQLYH